MMRAVAVVVCLASAGIIALYTHYSRDTGVPVYTVPVRAPEPAPTPPTPTVATKPVDPTVAARPVDPSDRAALARALQRELKRVGCYQGEVTGVWTTSSRMAMKTFNERVNATLPVDNPDPVLLSLVQGRRESACSTTCPPGQTPAEGGACMPAGAAAKAGKVPPEARSEAERPTEALPAAGAAASAGTTATTAALAATAAARTDTKAPAPASRAAAAGTVRPAAGEPNNPSGPVPLDGTAR